MMTGNNNPDGNNATEVNIIQTNEGAKDGQNKCPKCGSTDISFNIESSLLRCNFCRFEFQAEQIADPNVDLSRLEGTHIGVGATDIVAGADDIITLKCQSCGAEVVIDTNDSMGARCHWCRNTLSIAQQIPNGAVPDMVLPFRVNKSDAQVEINNFVNKRRFFAHPTFKGEFTTENIMGVYLPHMIVDKNAHVKLSGQGERLVRKYTVSTGRNSSRTVYDADLYNVEREFDLTIDGLKIIASSDKLDKSSSSVTNNVINAIKPFDVENSVKWDANYLRGFASEKRDTNIDDLREMVDVKAKDIARHTANQTLKEYDRGVRWNREELNVKGQTWKAAYLPVWLYSYQQRKESGDHLLHYVAVNARDKKTMGSVPINKARLFLISAIIQLLCTPIGLRLSWLILIADGEEAALIPLLLLSAGFLFYFYIYKKYRNKDARYMHETDTKTTLSNVTGRDTFVRRLTRLSNSKMKNANNESVGYKLGATSRWR